MSSRHIVYGPLLSLLISSVVIVGAGTSSAGPAPAMELDGLGVNHCPRQFCQQSQLLTTTKKNDVILVIAETCCNTKISTVNDDSGLSFTERLSYTSRTSMSGQLIWEYYAIANAKLEADNITVVADHCCYSVWGIQVLAISGADTSIVFDKAPSVPATVSCPNPECGDCSASGQNPGMCSGSIRTNAQDFVIASIPINDARSCGQSYPNGSLPWFSNITDQNNRFEVDYAITTRPQTTVQVDCGGTDAMAIVVDAIMASAQ